MSNWVFNDMKVYGNKKLLKQFKEDVTGVSESDFSFEKITPEPKDTSGWAEDAIPGWYNWRIEHWGTKRDAWDAKLSNKDNHLFYQFITAWSPPFPIYYTLVETYTELDFEIVAWESVNDWVYKLATENGQYTKFIEKYIEFVPWRNSQYKILYYRKDLLKNTLQVFKEEIFDEPKTKNLPAVTDDLEDNLEDLIDAGNRKY